MIMRNFITCFFTIIVMLIFLQHYLVASLSPVKQKTALFQFKQSLSISTSTDCVYESYNGAYFSPAHPKTMNWSMTSDYCAWEGVSCQHKTGDVIGLDLSCSQLEGAILPNSTLFQLSHLQSLNLFGNDFSLSDEFPQEFGFFAKGLTNLNLSYTRFSGRVPSGISRLYELVSLDLTDNYGFAKQLEDEVFKSLLQNLTQLRVLNLRRVDISSQVENLQNLSTSLRVLNLKETYLQGVVPQEVFQLPNLEVLALSFNGIKLTAVNTNGNNLTALYSNDYNLTATLPKVKWGSSATLQYLFLENVNIDGGIPDSIGFLESLVTLYLSYCKLSGPIPTSIGSLGQLTYLALDFNNLNGPIPTGLANLTNLRVLSLSDNNLNGTVSVLANLTNLRDLDLSRNNFTGPLSSWVSREFNSLDLSYNSLTGPIPPWLFGLPSLETLYLNDNGFTGQLYEFDSSKSKLNSFSCRNNALNEPIPQSFSRLVSLTHLDFSLNNFSGVLDFKMFSRLESLEHLDLSHNSLSVRRASMATLPPMLDHLGLSSCNIKEFLHFSRDAEIDHLDLSNNQIEGEIPHWIGLTISYLNLSHNSLTGGLEQLPWNNIRYLDLRSNMLNGTLPTLICNSTSLEILNLSHNKLSGALPVCSENLTFIQVFDLRMNNIRGNLPSTLSNFRNLQSINLHGNKLEGRIPSSFAEFYSLEVLDLGSNQINDTFPQCLEALPNLQVLVLKLNKFHGIINKSSKVEHPFPSLRIIDLSYNEFSGPLPTIYFKNFKAMMISDVNEIEPSYMGDYFYSSRDDIFYYSDSTGLVIKGVEIEVRRILNVFTTIDVSMNNFEGGIAEYFGNLVSLRFLNLSHNHLTGHIPSAIGNLSMMESLDLSFNRLEGGIPQQLRDINFLARLNLSFNQLSGHIPQGFQFDTFDNDSYVGNLGLCGQPLSKTCEIDIATPQEEEDDDYFFSGFTWKVVVIGYGCGVVPAFIIGNLMLLAGKPKWFAGIIARELGLKIRRMEIRMR